MLPSLFNVGSHRGPDSHPPERLQVLQQQVSDAATLADLSAEYHFYTPAMLYLHVRLAGRDPFHDFLIETRRTALPLSFRFDKPLFAGLDTDNNPAWNHYLYGMEHENFQPYLVWLGSLVISDVEKNLVSRVRYKEVEIVDPLFLQKQAVLPATLPRVRIVVFCLDTNQGCHYMDDAKDPLLGLPSYRYTSRSFDDTRQFAAAILSGNENPYQAVEDTQARDGMSVAEQEIRQRVAAARAEQPTDP